MASSSLRAGMMAETMSDGTRVEMRSEVFGLGR
jgi:hypothetical protein